MQPTPRPPDVTWRATDTRSPTTDTRRGVAAGAAAVEHQLPDLLALDEDRVERVANARERVRRGDHRGVHAGRDRLVLQLGDREQLHDVAHPRASAMSCGVIAAMPSRKTSPATTRALNAIDARIAHFAAAS